MPVTLAAMVASALRRAPASVRGTVVFTDKMGNTATGNCVVGLPDGAASESFKDASLIRGKSRALSVVPEGLAFKPLTGMYAAIEGQDWNVIGSVGVLPSGAQTDDIDDPATLLYLVNLSRP